MKKSILFIALAATISFTSCSKDDDKKCESCDALSLQICDNGDNTYTFTSDGTSETLSKEELGGVTPKQYVDAFCALADLDFGQ